MASSTCTLHCSIEDRRDEISTKYNATCERINLSHKEQTELLSENRTEPPGPEDQWQPFTEWLQDDGQLVYWIAGQPRSGKSTLMRFLHDDKTIQNRVRMWADGSRLAKVAFFLRKPTSYRDLIKELVYRAMDGRDLFPDLLISETQRLPNQSLPVEVFETAFRRLVSGDHGKYLFMIDGVEHTGTGAQTLLNLLGLDAVDHLDRPKGQSMKVCVSASDECLLGKASIPSSPGQTPRPSVRMETLTRVDIWRNISYELDNSRRFSQLCKNDPGQARGIIHFIAHAAAGSFLYARLTTAWVFGKLVEGEDVSDLHHQLPPTSNSLFEDMLSREYRSGLSTARLFGLIRQAEHMEKPLSLIVLSFVEELDNQLIEPGIKAATSGEIDERANKMHRYLFYRSVGLLEAPDFADVGALAKVRYHDTAKEWKTQLWKLVDNHSKDSRSGDMDRKFCTELCLAYLRRIKSLDPKQHTFFTSFRSLATACLKYSFKLEQPSDEHGNYRDDTNMKIVVALDDDAKKLLNERQPHSEKFFKTSHYKEPPLWLVKVQGHSNSYSTINPHWTNICDIDNYQPPSSLFDFALQHNLCSVVEHLLTKSKKQHTVNGNGNSNGTVNCNSEEVPRKVKKTRKQRKKEKKEKEKMEKKREKKDRKKRKQEQNQGQNPDQKQDSGEKEICSVHTLVGGRVLPLTLIARTQHNKGNPAPISVKMAEILFRPDFGADPNFEPSLDAPGGNTAWHALLKAMASEIPEPPPKETRSMTDNKTSTMNKTLTADKPQDKPQTDEERAAKRKELEADRKARCKKLLADLDRRYRLAQLAVLFLKHDADSYITVRAMPPPPEPDINDNSRSSADGEPSSVLRIVNSMGTRILKDATATVAAVRKVPKHVRDGRNRLKETLALTRDVNSAKLTLDQIIEAVHKLDEKVQDEINKIGTSEEIASMTKPDWEEVNEVMGDSRKADEAERGYILRERVWEQVKLFAR